MPKRKQIKTIAEAKKYFATKGNKITKAVNKKYWILHDYLCEDSGLLVTRRELINYARGGGFRG
jgi:hypothetical protein